MTNREIRKELKAFKGTKEEIITFFKELRDQLPNELKKEVATSYFTKHYYNI